MECCSENDRLGQCLFLAHHDWPSLKAPGTVNKLREDGVTGFVVFCELNPEGMDEVAERITPM